MEAEPDTKITIVRKEELNKVVEPEQIAEDEEPQIGVVKDEEEVENINKPIEADLPDQWEEKLDYKKPSLDLLDAPSEDEVKISEEELKQLHEAALKLGKAMGGEDALKNFNLMETRMRQLQVMDMLLNFME